MLLLVGADMALCLRTYNIGLLLLAFSLALFGCGVNKGHESTLKHSKSLSAMESLINGPHEELISTLKANPELVHARIGKNLPEPPLFAALKKMDETKVQALLEAGANPEAWSKGEEVRRRPLRWAVEKYMVLKSDRYDENSPSYEKRMLRSIELLLEHGANPNSRDDPFDNYAPLHAAAAGGEGMEQVVQLLIKYGAYKKIRTAGLVGKTPYELALSKLTEMEEDLSKKTERLEGLESGEFVANHYELLDLEYTISKKRKAILELQYILHVLQC